MCCVDSPTIGFGAILTDLEFALDAGNGNAKANNAAKHGAPESIGKTAPLFSVSGLVGLDEAGEESVFARIVFNEL